MRLTMSQFPHKYLRVNRGL